MNMSSYLIHNGLALELNRQILARYISCIKGVVIDLGCGQRPYESELKSVAEQYLGIDWSNSLHGLHADIVADINKPLPLKSASIDSVVSFQVMEHLCEPQTMLNEACRILKPGGVIFITVPFQWWVHEAPHDYFRYTRYGLEHMLGKAGFANIQIEESTGFWTMWLLKFNYQLNRVTSPKVPLVFRWILFPLITLICAVTQFLGPLLDRVWPEKRETAGYSVIAYKPCP